jgi:glycosyltransferase involved in cell wall biosynthesis
MKISNINSSTEKSKFSNVRNSPLRESNFRASKSPKQNKEGLLDKTISKTGDTIKEMVYNLKIAQVCHVFLPHIGGIELIAERTYRSLKNLGIESKVITTDLFSPKIKQKNYPYAYYGKTRFSIMRNPFSFDLIRHFIKNKYDIIQIHQIWFFTSLIAALFKKNAKIVTSIHGVYPEKLSFIQKILIFLFKPFAQLIIDRSNDIIVMTESEKKKLYKHFNIGLKPVHIIPYGIELLDKNQRIKNPQAKANEVFFKPPKRKSTLKGEGLDLFGAIKNDSNLEKEKIILFTGRIIPDKNPELLIKAMKLLGNKGYNLKVKFIGPIERSYKNKLMKLVEKLRINDLIIFKENIPLEKRPDLMNEYKNAYIFVSLGSWEGLPNRIMEAMQFGTPTIAFESGGSVELIFDKFTGLLINKLDFRELAEKIELLIKDKTLYKLLGENGKKLIEEEFDWEKNFLYIFEVYKR